MLWALPLTPLSIVAVAPALRRSSRALPVVSVGLVLIVLATAIWFLVAGAAPAALSWGPRLGLRLSLAGFGRVMAVLVPAVAAPIVAYALATEPQGRTRLAVMMVAFVGAMELLVVAADWLTLLLAWELVGALSWALIGHAWRDRNAPRAAAHAFVTTRFGDLGLYLAAGMTFAATGSLSLASLDEVGAVRLGVIAAAVLLAAGAKSAQVPFSPWLFSAMAGPTPVSALLHSATMVAAGAFLLVRLAPVLEPVGWWPAAVAGVGLATALGGGVVASANPDAKRVLAASTSAQYGLMLVAVGAGSPAAGGAHLVVHAVFKSLLFLGAGVAARAAEATRLDRMGLGRALPAAASLSALGALALAAVPPLGGAWTKKEIAGAALHTSGWLGAGVILAGFSSAFYAARYQLLVFGPARRRAPVQRPGRVEAAALGVLAGASVALGLLWVPGAGRMVESAVGGSLAGSEPTELAASLALIALGFGLAGALWRSKKLLTLGLNPPLLVSIAGWFSVPAAARALVVDPVLRLSAALARFDGRVIDAGVRAAVALAAFGSRLLARRGEPTIDGAVRAIAGTTMFAAHGSRATDEHAVDAAVESVAQGVGTAGRRSRLLETGLSHHYYVAVAAGLAVAVGVLALAR